MSKYRGSEWKQISRRTNNLKGINFRRNLFDDVYFHRFYSFGISRFYQRYKSCGNLTLEFKLRQVFTIRVIWFLMSSKIFYIQIYLKIFEINFRRFGKNKRNPRKVILSRYLYSYTTWQIFFRDIYSLINSICCWWFNFIVQQVYCTLRWRDFMTKRNTGAQFQPTVIFSDLRRNLSSFSISVR